MTWTGYLVSFAWRLALLAALFLTTVVLIDPYDILAFSLPVDRGVITPVDGRHHPALAPKHRFDNAIVGSSVAAQMNPKRLDRWVDGSFANIALLAAKPWEAKAMLELFLRRQPEPGAVLFELNHRHACQWREGSEGWRADRAPLQDWFFDDDPLNDLPFLFRRNIIGDIGKQLRYITTGRGLMPLDTHHWHRPPMPRDTVRERFKQHGSLLLTFEPLTAPDEPYDDPDRLVYGDHPLFQSMFESLPPDSLRIVVFPPLHVDYQPVPGSAEAARVQECKRRIADLAHAAGRAIVLDLLHPSALTREMQNYVDPMHLNSDGSDRLIDLIGATVRDGRPADATVRLLAN